MNNPQGNTPPSGGPVSSSATLTWLRHAIVLFVISFGAQITVAGQPLDLSSNTGKAAAVSGIASAIWVTLERVFLSGN